MLKAYFFRSRSRSQRKKTGAGKKRTGSATLPVFIQMGVMLITCFYSSLSFFARSGSGTIIPNQDPGRSSGSLRIRIHNTVFWSPLIRIWILNKYPKHCFLEALTPSSGGRGEQNIKKCIFNSISDPHTLHCDLDQCSPWVSLRSRSGGKKIFKNLIIKLFGKSGKLKEPHQIVLLYCTIVLSYPCFFKHI